MVLPLLLGLFIIYLKNNRLQSTYSGAAAYCIQRLDYAYLIYAYLIYAYLIY